MTGYPNPGASNYMERCMRRWLAQAGIYRCGACETWKSGVGPTNKRCRKCHTERMKARQAARKTGIVKPTPPVDDWTGKAGEYFAKQVALAPDYYTETRLWSRSSIWVSA